MNGIRTDRLLDIGIALSREKDGERLLELILTTAMDITNCDGGTLYICSGDFLEFKLMITKSMGILKGGRYGPIDLPPVLLSKENACARAAMQRKMYNVPDGYNSEEFEFSGPRQYDAITGYRTVSMLVMPMEDDRGNIIGVLQLLNALDETGTAVPFDRSYEQVIRSLASQAAISLTNMNYARSIQELMDSFVRVMSTAIDARTPYNANHTRGMVRVGGRFLDWLNQSGGPWTCSEEKKRLFLMSIWLHDIGKLTIPLEIMDKGSRLGSHWEAVRYRFQTITLLHRVALLEGRLSPADFAGCQREVEEATALLQRVNQAYLLTPQQVQAVKALGEKTYVDDRGENHPWLEPQELAALSILRGTLTREERDVMESHVVMTARMLAEMNFPKEYACVPEWAGKHHEMLNGSGYPQGLRAEDLPREARLLTILDVFDALTQERPYSPPQTVEQAFFVLEKMVRQGQLDGDILALFRESRAWEEDA